MEHTVELTDTVPPTPHDSPLTGGYIPGSDDGRLELEELMDLCTVLSNRAFITLTKRVKKLETQLKQKRSRAVIHSSDEEEPSMDIKDSLKQGRVLEELEKYKDFNLVSEQGEVHEIAELSKDDDDATLVETLLNIKRTVIGPDIVKVEVPSAFAVTLGAKNRPLVLDKTQYSSWASRMLIYIKGKENGAKNRPLVLDKTQYSSWASRMLIYIKGKENGLPQDIYNMVNHHDEAKHIWDRVKLLNEGSKISLQEKGSKLYDEFDRFTSEPRETIHSYYLRFAQLISDIHTIGMTMKPIQVNTKFINHLQSEWRKFVTDVKLTKDLHGTNFDHLYAYLRQHEAHANEHDALSVIDTKESLELAEESRLKMHAKQNDPIAKDEKVNIAPIDYAALNKLSVKIKKKKNWKPTSKVFTSVGY
nr:hypothetical protein [Tanacetum cinerariifolium]